MISDFILGLPDPIRKKCEVTEDRICIAQKMSHKEAVKNFSVAAMDLERRDVRAVIVTATKKPQKFKSITHLLQSRGR